MQVVRTVAEMHDIRRGLEGPVSMMATLGGMHAGHEALIDRAREMGRSIVASLFLNPTQFNDPQDLETYPTDRERDLDIFRSRGVDVVFAPAVAEMYPPDAVTEVDPGPLGECLEGAHRPGHLRAVATVVTKILTVIRPDIAVWGAKDAQQNAVIRGLSRDLLMDVRHEIVPTVRAEDGLALSSRNARLSLEARRAATVLHRGLEQAGRSWREGERRTSAVIDTLRNSVATEPSVRLEYATVVEGESFYEVEEASRGCLLVLAAWVGGVRLIDNVELV